MPACPLTSNTASRCADEDTATLRLTAAPPSCEEYCDAFLTRATEIDIYDLSVSGWIWVSFGVFAPLCLFGIIGNLLTIIMFAKYIKKTTTSVFIIALGVVDLLVCTTSMPFFLYSVLVGKDIDIICKLELFITFLAVPLSGAILIVIAIDRFLLIFLVKTNVITQFRAKLIIGVIGACCLLIAIPQPLSYTSTVLLFGKGNSFAYEFCGKDIICETHVCKRTNDIINQRVSYALWQVVMYLFLLMVAAFVILYSLIFTKVYRMYKTMASWGHNSSSSSAAQQRTVTDHSTSASEQPANTTNEKPKKSELDRLYKMSGGKGRLLAVEHSESEGIITEEVSLMKLNTPSKPAQSSAPSVSAKKKRLPHLHTAITLFMVTSSFTLAYTPMVIMMFMGSCSSYDPDKGNSYVKCPRNDYRHFIWHFFFLNHITNPVIYSFMNPRFTDALKTFFRKIGCLKT